MTPNHSVLAAQGRGLSVPLWRGIDLTDLQNNPSLGYCDFDDFLDLATGKHTATQATAGTFTALAGRFGHGSANSGSTTGGQGINIQKAPIFAPVAGDGMILFEGRFYLSANSTGPQFFLGLHEADTTILSSAGALTSDDLVGFQSISGNTLLAKNQNTAAAIQSATLSTGLPTDGSYMQLGFRIIGTKRVDFYQNGIIVASSILSIPTANLAMSLVCQTNGTTQPVVNPDWWAAAYVAQADYGSIY
jgi:hypothetical protein